MFKKIKLVDKALDSLNKVDVQHIDIREVLRNRVGVTNILNIEYQRKRSEYKATKMNFDIWWAEKYSEQRKLLNPDSKPGNKWLSKSDIESEAIVKNRNEYFSKRSELEDIENQKDFLKQLIDSWNSIQFDITHLLKILDHELFMSGDSIKPRKKRRIQG